MTKTIDFDSFRAEQNQEPIEFIIGGETYNLPGSIPASLAVDIIKMQTALGDDAEVPADKIEDFGRSLFGRTVWEDLLIKHRITVDELGPLLEQVMAAYTDSPKETAETAPPTSPTQESDSA